MTSMMLTHAAGMMVHTSPKMSMVTFREGRNSFAPSRLNICRFKQHPST